VLARTMQPRGAMEQKPMSTDSEWWTWVVIGTIFLLATYVPVAIALCFF